MRSHFRLSDTWIESGGISLVSTSFTRSALIGPFYFLSAVFPCIIRLFEALVSLLKLY